MKNKKIITIALAATAVILIVIVTISTTQAYYSDDKYANNPVEYQTGILSIEAVSKSNNISLENTLPMGDDDGLRTTPYVFTIKNNGNVDYKFDVRILTTNDNTFDSQYIKLQIDKEGVTTLSSLTNSIIKKDVVLHGGETMDISIRIWLSSDTKNTQIGKEFNSKIVIDGQSIYTETNYDMAQSTVPSVEDFTYYLGSNYEGSIEVLTNYKYGNKQANLTLNESIPISTNEILLARYNGSSTNITIPSTYTINNTTYKVVVLSKFYSTVNGTDAGIFYANESIEEVHLPSDVKYVISDDKKGYATNNIDYLFYGCSSLINVPEIPNTITSMYETFYSCTNLTGTIKINSSNVVNVNNIFTDTVKNIKIQVPNNSTTYTNLKALTTSSGMPSNVTLTTY